MPPRANCIYCDAAFNPAAGEGDHIVPAAFGEFTNLRDFRGACLGCNNEIGKSEAQLIRCGPESLVLPVAEPPRRRTRMSGSHPGAMGAPPPAMVSERHGACLIVRPVRDEPGINEVVDCLDVIDKQGKHHPIPIFPGMSARAIRSKIDALGIEGLYDVHFSVSVPESPWIESIIEELWPGARRTEFPVMDVGPHSSIGRVTCMVTDHYFRAVAKIAFHYYLCYNASGLRGDEPEFAELRAFIKGGGKPEQFFTDSQASPVYFGVPFGEVVGSDGGVMPSEWCHLLAVDDTQQVVVAYVQLLCGPGQVTPPHYVMLGNVPAGTRKPGAMAHLLTWTPGSRAKGDMNSKNILAGARPDTFVGEAMGLVNPIYTLY